MSCVLDILDGMVVSSTTRNPVVTGTLPVMNKRNVVITYGKY